MTIPMPQSRIRPSRTVVSTTHGDQVILMNVATRRYHDLNAVGGLIWKGLCQGRPLDAIVDDVVRDYDVADAVAHSDVRSFTNALIAAGLVQECE
jgi:hypothetical protein